MPEDVASEMRPGRSSYTRTREIEEWSNLVFIHPLSERLARAFDRLGVHPNAVSLMGMAFGVGAGVAYHHVESTWPAALGFVLMIAWHVFDGADGQLARLSGKTSEIGKMLDGVADHVAFAAVYAGLATALAEQYGLEVWLIVIVAGLSHLVQSAAYEYQRHSYDFFVHGASVSRVPTVREWRQSLRKKRGAARLLGAVYLVYLYVQNVASAANGPVYAGLRRALRNHSHADAVRTLYRRVHLDVVRAWSVLCSNYRTLAIFVFSLAGVPLYYFIYEIVVLNVALVLLSQMRRRRDEMLSEWIDEVSRGKAA